MISVKRQKSKNRDKVARHGSNSNLKKVMIEILTEQSKVDIFLSEGQFCIFFSQNR